MCNELLVGQMGKVSCYRSNQTVESYTVSNKYYTYVPDVANTCFTKLTSIDATIVVGMRYNRVALCTESEGGR